MYKLIICTFQWCEIVAHMDSKWNRKYCVGMQVKETQKIEIFINFMIKIAAALQQYIFHQMYAINFPVDIFCTNIQVQIECRIQFLWSQQKKTIKLENICHYGGGVCCCWLWCEMIPVVNITDSICRYFFLSITEGGIFIRIFYGMFIDWNTLESQLSN